MESEDSAGEDGQAWAEELANHMASISARKPHRIVAEKQATPRTSMEQRIQADEYIRIREFPEAHYHLAMSLNLRQKEGEDDSSGARFSWGSMGSSSRYKLSHAAHLYPWRATSMDTIFSTDHPKSCSVGKMVSSSTKSSRQLLIRASSPSLSVCDRRPDLRR